MNKMQQALAAHPFLEGLPPSRIQDLSDLATEITVESGEYIFRSGDPASHCYMVTCGQVIVEIYDARKGPIEVQSMEAPCVLGWSWLIEPYTWCFDARAIQLTRMFALDAEQLRERCEASHELGYNLLKRFTKVLGERLHAARLQLLDLYGNGGK